MRFHSDFASKRITTSLWSRSYTGSAPSAPRTPLPPIRDFTPAHQRDIHIQLFCFIIAGHLEMQPQNGEKEKANVR